MRNQIILLKEYSRPQKMGIVITTSEGGVILVDGGYACEAEETLERLREITGKRVPHLDAVILTHPHRDHIGVFVEWAGAREGEIEFDRVYYNFPSVSFMADNGEPNEAEILSEFYALLPRFAEKARIISGGDTFTVRGAHFRVLYTTDCEFTMNVGNNASAVFEMTLSGKKTLFLGDCGVEAGEKLIRMYGDGLKADLCQMAHHGQNGVTKAFYEIVRPSTCLWCAPDWLWNNDAGLGFNTHVFQTVTVRGWMDEISPDRRDYVTMNGEQTVELDEIDDPMLVVRISED